MQNKSDTDDTDDEEMDIASDPEKPEDASYDPQEDEASTSTQEEITFEIKKNAVRFWQLPGGKKRKFSSVQNRHRFVKSKKALKKWKKEIENGTFLFIEII